MHFMKHANRSRAVAVRSLLVVVAFIVLLVSTACDPLPRRRLEVRDRIADAFWVDTQLREYAPKEYKERLLKFNYEKEFEKLVNTVATEGMTNQEHLETLQGFISMFADAHMSTEILPSNLPGRVEIAFIGVSGTRVGNDFVVSEVLPTESSSNFPLRPGDRIVKVDGLSLPKYIEKNLVRFRNLGDREANITYHMNGVFTRLSIENGTVPRGSDSVITVKRPTENGWKEENVTLPWIVKDLYDYTVDIIRLREMLDTGKIWGFEVVDRAKGNNAFKIGLLDMAGRPFNIHQVWADAKKYKKGLKYLNSFNLNLPMGWTTDPKKLQEQDLDSFERLKKERKISANALKVDLATTYPAYFTLEDVYDKNGKPTGRKRGFGYIRIDTFSPGAPEEMVVEELKQTLDTFQRNGVKDIVIDQINNGGGSVSLVLQVAQAFSNKPIQTFGIQFGLGDNWLDDFHRGELWGPNDTERELQRRLLVELEKDKAEGKTISRPFPIESLIPYQLKPNDRLKKPFNIVLLINEMSASAADMFPAMMKDNKLATLVGRKTMGAGGNVVSLMNQSPGIRLKLRRTESLLVRPNGEYIENVGVTPDIAIDPTLFAYDRYEGMIEIGRDILQQGPAKFQMPDLTKYHACERFLKK